MSEERRGGSRSRTQLIAFVKNPATGRVKRWLTKNLSGIGVCLVADELFERDSRLELELKLPDFPTELQLSAEVVWVMTTQPRQKSYDDLKTEIGVKFVDVPPKTQALLNQYVAMNAPPPELT